MCTLEKSLTSVKCVVRLFPRKSPLTLTSVCTQEKSLTSVKCVEKHLPISVPSTAFSNISDLNKHTRVHTGEKSHKCHVCGRAFSRKHNLNRHQILHSKSEDQFTEESNLTGQELEQSAGKQCTCEICCGTFRKKDKLRKHFLAHEATDWYQFLKKAYECWRCEKYFALQEDMVKHHRRYHAGYPGLQNTVHPLLNSHRAINWGSGVIILVDLQGLTIHNILPRVYMLVLIFWQECPDLWTLSAALLCQHLQYTECKAYSCWLSNKIALI